MILFQGLAQGLTAGFSLLGGPWDLMYIAVLRSPHRPFDVRWQAVKALLQEEKTAKNYWWTSAVITQSMVIISGNEHNQCTWPRLVRRKIMSVTGKDLLNGKRWVLLKTIVVTENDEVIFQQHTKPWVLLNKFG